MRLALTLVLAMLVAGCVTPPPSEEGEEETETMPSQLVYGDCDELLGAFPVQEDAVALPEGFTAAPFIGQGNGAIFVVGWECATAETDTNQSESAAFVEGAAGFSVTPPEELALEGAFGHAILLGISTGSPLAVATYEAWGIPVGETAPTFSWQAAPIGGTGTFEGPLGPLDVAMRVTAGGPPASDAASAVRFFVVEGDAVTAAWDISWIQADGFQGQAQSTAALPGAPPTTAGLGFYYTSDEPARYTMTPFALPQPAEPEE